MVRLAALNLGPLSAVQLQLVFGGFGFAHQIDLLVVLFDDGPVEVVGADWGFNLVPAGDFTNSRMSSAAAHCFGELTLDSDSHINTALIATS